MRRRTTERLLAGLALSAGLAVGGPAWADEAASSDDGSSSPDDGPSSPDDGSSSPDDGWIELSVPVDFGSALDDPALDGAPNGTDDAGLAELVALDPDSELALPGKSPTLRSRVGVRPWLGAFVRERTTGPARGSAGAGATVGWQWWSLRATTLQPAGETQLQAVAPFGGLKGWQLGLDSVHGAWLGPVGLLVGPSVQAGALNGPADLDPISPALLLGPTARLALQLGSLVPWVAGGPRWQLAGSRPHGGATALGGPWDGLALGAGVVLDSRPLGLRLSAERIDTIGDSGTRARTWQAALGLHLRLL
ncbi:MAG: hypothetical protein H6742_19120 [Alphaproteobacteria bacterium]|nr:hypothetical protein [Alphaproteobacteria bacterium]